MKNRVIKFRGLASNGQWVYGTPVYYQSGEVAIFNDSCPKYGYEATRIAEMREIVDPNTVGQYTGLLDKDGKDIFEGDQLKGRHGIYLVEDMIIFHLYISQNPHWFSDQEIIGNIHQNPELTAL